MSDAICAAVYGRRGSGKTTLVQRLARSHPRRIAFDPTGEYSRALGWASAASLGDVHRHVRQHWHHGFQLAYTPAGAGDGFPATLSSLSHYIWEAQRPFEIAADRRQLLLVVEEMNLSFPATALPRAQSEFLRLVLQGRHRGIGIIGVTQRPALVSANFRGNVAETYAFALGWEDDARLFGRVWAHDVQTLEPHHYIRFADGAVSRGKNPPRRAPILMKFTR